MATATSHLIYFTVVVITASDSLIFNSGGRDLSKVEEQAKARRKLFPDARSIKVTTTGGRVVSHF